MQLTSYITTCYPEFTLLGRAIETLPLSARSLLIKSCQAQTCFLPDDTSPLAVLIQQHPPVSYVCRGIVIYKDLIDFFPSLDVDISDPLRSAIVLDLLRCSPLNDVEVLAAREKGWATEIRLAETPGYPTCNFTAFFTESDQPIHPDLPHNLPHLYNIRNRFRKFRQRLIEYPRYFYPRATHKNMSRSTRRAFETEFGTPVVDTIFGQDDWERVYHEHGIMLDGLVEMRQKWYPSGAKPRTYFAMGGTCYRTSRFLQDFFTDLVNIFPATNHITRLRPSRLRLSYVDDEDHYRIYDLSSFTSNMTEQRAFMESLKEFMRGVMVVIVDEVVGPMEVDLGDLLDEYHDTCVVHPELSYERSIFEDLANDSPREHARASLLGIFGNLMTCTVSHYLLVSPTVTADDELNIAGDDGLILETLLNKYLLDVAISLVGDCAPDKTMLSDDLGAVCLKRPLIEDRPSLTLLHNIVPPNLATTLSYLLGKPFDSRFEFFGLEDMKLEDRLSILGKDLLRFLESCFAWGVSAEEAQKVLNGFQGLVRKIHRINPRAGNLGKTGYIWPIEPSSYDYYSVSPTTLYAHVCCTSLSFQCRGYFPIVEDALRFVGDSVSGNSDRRLVLLERLGYLEKKSIVKNLSGLDSVTTWLGLQKAKNLDPGVYEYVCVKDIPEQFIYTE